MPTYEYRCKQCGEHLEVVQSFKDDALTECHACGGELRKVFGSVGIVFKGSGFYKTDSRSGSSAAKTAAKAESGSEAKVEKVEKPEKSEKKSDTKPATSGTAAKSESSSGSTSSPAAAAS